MKHCKTCGANSVNYFCDHCLITIFDQIINTISESIKTGTLIEDERQLSERIDREFMKFCNTHAINNYQFTIERYHAHIRRDMNSSYKFMIYDFVLSGYIIKDFYKIPFSRKLHTKRDVLHNIEARCIK
jgi:hypothetical protein